MIHVRHESQEEVVLELSGPLDVRTADELATIALQQPGSVHVVIDIARAAQIHDSALGRLVDCLPRSRSHSIRGATRHQHRLLAYLGKSAENDPPELAHTD